MENNRIVKAFEALEKDKVRNFDQSIDLIILLKDFELKTNPIDFFIATPNKTKSKCKICAFVGPQMEEQAKENTDLVLRESDFIGYQKNPKKAKKLACEYDWFISQADMMGKVASAFGRSFGPRGKMPNPKAGCVVPPNAQLEPLVDKLNRTVRLTAKKQPVFQCKIGTEKMSREELVGNASAIIDAVTKQLPSHSQNIKAVLIKKTMGKPVVL